MGDTVEITFTKDWEEIQALTTGVTYNLQNVNSADLFLLEEPTQPAAVKIGKRLEPSVFIGIIKEASAVWIRSKTSKGIAIYNSIP